MGGLVGRVSGWAKENRFKYQLVIRFLVSVALAQGLVGVEQSNGLKVVVTIYQ